MQAIALAVAQVQQRHFQTQVSAREGARKE